MAGTAGWRRSEERPVGGEARSEERRGDVVGGAAARVETSSGVDGGAAWIAVTVGSGDGGAIRRPHCQIRHLSASTLVISTSRSTTSSPLLRWWREFDWKVGN
uniref:Uncharacterized protein n=1 Tax=Oryza meridionalis TaxID=40149 RepID=A0A0E0DD78_9ORYZ